MQWPLSIWTWELVACCGVVAWSAGVVQTVAYPHRLVGTCAESVAQPNSPFQWQIEEGESIGLLDASGKVMWRFVYGETKTHPYFHPIALSAGKPLTVASPGDHVHHHGLWFCWKYINGVNFWEHVAGTDRPAGRTEWDVVEIEAGEGYSARIELAVRYVLPGGEIALREQRVIETSAPDEDGGFTIDFSGSFIAEAEEVLLDRTPLPGEPGGKVYGGYAGLSARLVQLENRRAFTLEGVVEFNSADRYRGRSNAFEYSGEIEGEAVGIAILSDPANLNAPSPWYAIRTGVMSFFTPAVICYGPHRMQGGEGFDLRYRVVVHPGKWGREELAQAFEEYTGKSAVDDKPGKSKEESDR